MVEENRRAVAVELGQLGAEGARREVADLPVRVLELGDSFEL